VATRPAGAARRGRQKRQAGWRKLRWGGFPRRLCLWLPDTAQRLRGERSQLCLQWRRLSGHLRPGRFYAADTIVWQGTTYNYPLNLYSGQDIGPLDDIIAYPNYTLTAITFVDTTFGSGTLQQLYYGGGYHTLVSGATNVGKLTYGGTYNNQSAVVRFNYGSGQGVSDDDPPGGRRRIAEGLGLLGWVHER